MKKILIFSLAYYPRVGGAEIAVKEITDRISPDEIEFHIVTLRFSQADAVDEKIGNVFVHRLLAQAGVGSHLNYLSKMLFIPHAALKARALHKVLHFDAWWAMMSYMVLPVVLLRFIGIKLPYVLTLQDGAPFEQVFSSPHILLFRSLLKSGFKNATVVQVISNYLGGWAKKMGYVGPIEVIPNGYTPIFAQTPSWFVVDPVNGKALFWQAQLIPPTQTILLTTSRLVYKNGLDTVIRALPLIPNAIFVILGEGVEQENLQKLVDELHLRERVYFLGNIPHTELAEYLHAADIFVRPSRSEGMGNSFIEAMAAGLPVIATQEGGIADFLFDAKRNPDKPTTGWAVDRDSPEQIVKAVEDIRNDDKQVEKVIQNAKVLVEEKYTWTIIAKDMQERVFNQKLGLR